jgi:predicted 3-demethylubiquinone-9 3-methyltransferase (glyoxalase superfamily)
MQKITPFLWFDGNVAEALDFYTSVFKDSKIITTHRSGGPIPGQEGKIFSATFELAGQELYALDGGPQYKFTPATSFFVNCETQEEIDGIWKKLAENGTVLMELNKYPFSEKFGWVQDKFGLSWQLNLTGTKQKITPFLMFVGAQQGKAEEAINFYRSVFKDSEVLRIAHFGPGQGGTEGTVVHAAFSLDGQQFMAMDSNGKHAFTFTYAVSFFVSCETQEEVDYLWNALSAGGEESMCGWLKDKYGVAWQIIPDVLGKLLYDKDPVKSGRVVEAMMKMHKIVIKDLQDAYG